MKTAGAILFVALLSFAGFAQKGPRPPRVPAAPKIVGAVLPIKRVVLYSNGVAYIERRGTVTGNAEIDLSFKQSQVDDVLKSMIVLDLGKGQIGAVSYNSSQPAAARMSEIPFGVTPVSGDGQGISAVLSQLQGARVSVTSEKETATGSILTIERKQVTGDKGTRTTNVLVIASETGEISSFDLAEVRSVKLLDDGTKRDVKEFASAAASARRLDARTITVTSRGMGTREMIVSYTIAAPIWKTTYRVVLDKEGKPFFQGWAIVDNVSDESWNGVQMSLVSGSPISFIQNLQNPVYRYRPVVPTPSDLKLRPQTYEPQSTPTRPGGQSTSRNLGSVNVDIGDQLTGDPNENKDATVIKGKDLNALPDDPDELAAALQALVGVNGAQIYIDGFTGGQLPAKVNIGALLSAQSSGVRTATTAGDVGDLFEYKIDQPVTVERDHSALIPIVQTQMEGERVSIYNESIRSDRPYGGVMLKNTSGLTLESGSMTVLDGDAYAGEALLDRLKPNEQRLISFALDLGTHVIVRRESTKEPARSIKASAGVLKIQYLNSEHLSYKITNQTDKPRAVYVEYPIREGWELTAGTPKPESETQSFYRFRVDLGPNDEKELKIGVGKPLTETLALTTLSMDEIDQLSVRGSLDAKTRASLEAMIGVRTQIASIDTRIEGFGTERESIEADQGRFRSNIESLSKTPEAKALIERYIAKAGEQETRLEEIEKEKRSLENDRKALTEQLAAQIKGFEIE